MTRNVTDIRISILYSATLPNSLMRCSIFLQVSLGFFKYSIMSSANSDNFTSFPICIPIIYFSCLATVARISNSMLNKSGESEHPCLIPDFSVNVFSFLPFSMMLALSLS